MASILDDCKQEMEQTVVAFKRDLSRLPHGTRHDRAPRRHRRRVLRRQDAAEPAGVAVCARAPAARGAAVRSQPPSGTSSGRILTSDLGLTPQNDGKIIRIPIPELTEERRRDLVKHVKKLAEEFRVSVRSPPPRRPRDDEGAAQGRRSSPTTISKRDRERVEHLTKEYVEKVDKVLKTKEEEIMAV